MALVVAAVLSVADARAQDTPAVPELQVGVLEDPIDLNGRLDEISWKRAPVTDAFRTVEPVEGGDPNGRTELRVLADAKAIYIGVRCFDSSPDGIVAYSVARDARLSEEDSLKIVVGTFNDGRTGYVFAVNPRGARYDALIAARGEGENSQWNGPWEARTTIDEHGWSAELRLPVSMLSFDGSLDRWQFNVERRVQRLLERSRWANPRLDQRITQISRSGFLVGLPRFDLGLGLTVTPSGVLRGRRESRGEPAEFEAEPSLDVAYRFTPEFTGILTVNTDFAETEVDRRRVNLTRFPLFFPEKRTFFLEGADAFDFGLGLRRNLVPFHSRRIGLVGGNEVPLEVGVKTVGRIGGTSIGALVSRTGDEEGVAPGSTMGVVRLRQDVLAQSTVGLFTTFGDPLGRDGSYVVGADATYQTSELFGGRNFLVGGWGLTMGRDDVEGAPAAYGGKIDYPNDDWDVSLTYMHIDDEFDPSLGFVPRDAINSYRLGADYALRPDNGWLRRQVFETSTQLVTDLQHEWESWRVFTAPVNANFESGDGFEFNVIGQGERIDEAFELGDGVIIPLGEYDWIRYRIVAETAAKRWLAGEISYGFGSFYDGMMDQWELVLRTVVSPWLTIRATGDIVRGELPSGLLSEDFYGLEADFTFSPDLTLNVFAQYDTESDSLGSNTRLRWDITPAARLFFIVNADFDDPANGADLDGYGTALKVQYELRF